MPCIPHKSSCLILEANPNGARTLYLHWLISYAPNVERDGCVNATTSPLAYKPCPCFGSKSEHPPMISFSKKLRADGYHKLENIWLHEMDGLCCSDCVIHPIAPYKIRVECLLQPDFQEMYLLQCNNVLDKKMIPINEPGPLEASVYARTT